MYDFLSDFDGSGRRPREVQQNALNWLAETWTQGPIAAMSLPVGSGKSAIAHAIQRQTGAHVITPSNILIDQYGSSYPEVNFLKGRTHYTCKTAGGLSCEDWVNTLSQPACENCPYSKCRNQALEGEPTFFNPMSYYYLKRAMEGAPSVLIVDEAHQLLSMLMLLCGLRLPFSKYHFTNRCANEIYLLQWLDDQIIKLTKMFKQHSTNKDYASKILSIISSMKLVRQGVGENPQNYAIWIEKSDGRKKEMYLNVKPLQLPRFLSQNLLQSKKLILMSGTLLPSDLNELLGERPYLYIDLPSPIAKDRRPIYYEPAPFKINFQTDPKKLVALIESYIDRNPGLNTIIHVTYSSSKRLRPHFKRKIIFNESSADKDIKVEQFKKEGGVFLAAGCAEGLDLKDNLCRLNIIPQLPYPAIGDPVVKKRMALADGELWYNMEALKTAIQAAGRSTRNENDYSKTYILDPQAGWRIRKYKDKLPRAFTESIVWTKETTDAND